jgi:hypothetical protein
MTQDSGINAQFFLGSCAVVVITVFFISTMPGQSGTIYTSISGTQTTMMASLTNMTNPGTISFMGFDLPNLFVSGFNLVYTIFNMLLMFLEYIIGFVLLCTMLPSWLSPVIIIAQLYMLYGFVDMFKGFL